MDYYATIQKNEMYLYILIEDIQDILLHEQRSWRTISSVWFILCQNTLCVCTYMNM